MHAGLHALGWSLQRLAVVLGVVVAAAILAYIAWVFVIIAVQAVTALGQ
jgi:type IV secretory pathway VirB3-like protein